MMEITWQRFPRCLWHSNCENHFGGIMTIVQHDPTESLLECLHCGQMGRYPVGGVGRVCVDVVAINPVIAAEWAARKAA